MINQASKKQKNEDLTLTRYSSAHLDRAEVMAENVWHLVQRASTGACSIASDWSRVVGFVGSNSNTRPV